MQRRSFPRRSFLKGSGAVLVVVAGAGVWRAYDEGVFSVGEGRAYQPWKDWQNESDGPLALVRAAILAASPHNTQPWLFKVTDKRIELYADTGRYPGALDPYLREQHIGLGCALENLMLGAAANGYNATATLLPGKLQAAPSDPQPQLVAHLDLSPGTRQSSVLHDAIPHRHTNRSPYDVSKPVPADVMDALSGLTGEEPEVKIFLFNSQSEKNRIVEIIAKANHEVYADPDVEDGSQRWIRWEWSDIQKHCDGLTVDAFGLPPLTAAFTKFTPKRLLVKFAPRGDPYADLLRATPVFGLIAVRDRYDQEQSLRAGRIWQRAHLLLTSRGVAARPVNEAVELIDHERRRNQDPRASAQLAELTHDATWQPTFMFRIGYPVRPALASPRRPLKDVII
jgi:nitroreductase